MDERIDTLEAKMGNMEEYVKSFLEEFCQSMVVEMIKWLGHVPKENCSLTRYIFIIIILSIFFNMHEKMS